MAKHTPFFRKAAKKRTEMRAAIERFKKTGKIGHGMKATEKGSGGPDTREMVKQPLIGPLRDETLPRGVTRLRMNKSEEKLRARVIKARAEEIRHVKARGKKRKKK